MKIRNLINLINILALILLFSCETKGKNSEYQKSYQNRVLLSYLIRTTPDPQAQCEQTSISAGKCLYKASDVPSIASFISEEKYSANLLANTVGGGIDTYADFCRKEILSDRYKNYSDEAKVCNLQCQKNYWDYTISIDNCKNKKTLELFTELGSGITNCIKNCFKVVNNE